MSNMSDAGKDASSSASTCVSIAVLGASGDLAKKKTYPALFKLFEKSFLPKDVIIIGYARSAMTNESLRDQLRGYLKGKKEEVDAFLQLCIYVAGQYKLSPAEEGAPPKDFQVLANTIAEFEATFPGDCGKNRLFYLALPPVVYPPVCEGIKKCCMSPYGWSRVVVEKPFGKDLASSEDLNEQICGLFDEKQLYRIDHYLGKEIVQNLMVMRFANTFISPLWNRDNISNIQIIFKEPFGTEGRGGYFDQYGIIRDVIQNHLLQVMALVAMERPATLSPNDMRDEKLKVLKCISPLSTENTVLGQYTMGKNGQPGYLEDDTVPPGSKCPTFAMVVLYVQNERWDGVPFILKAGKALNEHKMEVRVQLKDVAGELFHSIDKPGVAGSTGYNVRNEFVMRVQPDPSIYMKMTVKEPGMQLGITQSELELQYNSKYGEIPIPDAYERLILDCLNGDQQHFVRRDELVEAWKIFTPILHYIDAGGITPEHYPYGSRGPALADKLRERVGHITSITAADITWDEDEERGPRGLKSP
ncbi:hypothetical protein CYMTET_53303 [Cymbomonas tetramitiformis]|uniref:Glucose-6-phosphate 1-dehydrogenase n=1 Tax=Cymbomonas tetramitiformis TaxID=36881 RepID=A0AAE0BH65_9CHLO|nr:hypothetical protein CYMTET_53303 [Cymbomonas tetramitiformis]